MAPVQPSDREEEYFAREEYERLKRLAADNEAKENEAKREEQKNLHFMHCPKCGGDLVEINFKTIHIDKCTLCEGVWLDPGELELIIAQEDATVLKRILKVFR